MVCENRGDGPKSCRNVQFLPFHVQVDPRTLAAGSPAVPLVPPNSATLSPLKASEANTHGTDRAGAARVMPGRRGRWRRLRAGLRRVPSLARPDRPKRIAPNWRACGASFCLRNDFCYGRFGFELANASFVDVQALVFRILFRAFQIAKRNKILRKSSRF
jgi:hypothetical protein